MVGKPPLDPSGGELVHEDLHGSLSTTEMAKEVSCSTFLFLELGLN
jgi:hypothetical protein